MSDYKNVPVDHETYQMLAELIEAYEMPARSYGAMVKKLTKPRYEELAAAKLMGKKANKEAKSKNNLAETQA